VTTAAEPQEDELGGSRLACFSGVLATCSLLLASASSSLLLASASSSLLAFTSGLLVEKFLTMGSLLALVGGTLVKELLTTSGLLSLTSGFLVEKAFTCCRMEAMALVLPQFIERPLPILVGSFCASASPKTNWPPGQFRRHQPSGLFVFAKCSLEPSLAVKGRVCSIIFEHPVGGAWGRLGPFVWQPP
jgi:hypothetical protein